MVLLAFHGGNPAVVLVGIAVEPAIAEVAAKQSKLPHVVGDIFTVVTHGAIGADNYFLVFFGDLVIPGLHGRGARAYAVCACTVLDGSGTAHYPAAFVLTFALERENKGCWVMRRAG